MNVYFLSGLGVDRRMFARLKFPAQFEIDHIDWILPLKRELLINYAKRLLSQMDGSQPFVLVGYSFGGMVAVEISKLLKAEQIILISSVSTTRQIPWYYRVFGKLKLHTLIPACLFKIANPLTYWLFGAKTKEQKVFLKQILIDTDTRFLKWAISKVLTWDNKVKPKNLYHIHAIDDKILPVKYTQADAKIENGGHLMVYKQPEKISKLITEKIKNPPTP